MRRVLVLGLLLLTTSCSAPPAAPAAATTAATRPAPSTTTLPPEIAAPGDQATAFVDGQGTVVPYLVHAPATYTPETTYPLVLVFHGHPGTPQDMVELTKMNEVADANDFLVVYPRNVSDSRTVSALLDHLGPKWNVDPNRIHVAGFSVGGSFVYQLAIELPGRFGSVAPVSAARNGSVTLPHPLSLITFQGSYDRLHDAWSTTNAAWDAGAGCSGETTTTTAIQDRPTTVSSKTCANGTEHVVYSVTGMSHTWPAGASELIWEFFAEHPLA